MTLLNQRGNGSSNRLRKILLQGAIPLSVADAASKGSNVLVALLIARYFGPNTYGQYATATAICGISLIVTGIGFEQEFTKRGGIDQKTISSSLRLNFIAIAIMSFFSYLGLLVFFAISSYPQETVSLGLTIGLVLIASRFHLPFRHLCLLLNKSLTTAIIQILATISIFILSAFVIYAKLNIIYLVIFQLVVAVFFIFVWLKWIPGFYLKGKVNSKDVKIFFYKSLPFAFSNMLWIAYFNFDTFMLSLLRSEAEVGVYAGIYRIIGINYILGYAIANSYTPKLFKLHQTSKIKFAKTGRKLIALLLSIGSILSLSLYAFSHIIIPLIIGDSYQIGVTIARILSIAVFFRLLNFGLCEILTTSNRQNSRVQLEAIMLLINIIFNAILIPIYGGEGAATATIIAEVFLLIGSLFFCYRSKLLNNTVKKTITQLP